MDKQPVDAIILAISQAREAVASSKQVATLAKSRAVEAQEVIEVHISDPLEAGDLGLAESMPRNKGQ